MHEITPQLFCFLSFTVCYLFIIQSFNTTEITHFSYMKEQLWDYTDRVTEIMPLARQACIHKWVQIVSGNSGATRLATAVYCLRHAICTLRTV